MFGQPNGHVHHHRHVTRLAPRALILVVLALLLTPGTASADPPGPTDFKTEVLSIEPPTAAFEIEIIGGDSFVLLRQSSPATIEVVGYNGEPYLRFLPSGEVEQNRLSPAVYLNEERFGDAVPDFADPAADPEWELIADDGSYAWHDHRAHLMVAAPINTGPGDQVLEGVVPIRVDGANVDVVVGSTWQPAPSLIPFVVGGVIGLAGVLAAARRRQAPAVAMGALTVAALLALTAGLVQYLSVPAETGPSLTLVALPSIALACAIAALAIRHRPATSLPVAIGAAAALITFAALRLPGSAKAILPTELSMPFDRAISVFVAVVGVGCLLIVGGSFSRLMRAPEPA